MTDFPLTDVTEIKPIKFPYRPRAEMLAKTRSQMHAEPFRDGGNLLKQISWIWLFNLVGCGLADLWLIAHFEYRSAMVLLLLGVVPFTLLARGFDMLGDKFRRIARDIETSL